jgi:sporulation protein YlmC with PRC-barrel domain
VDRESWLGPAKAKELDEHRCRWNSLRSATFRGLDDLLSSFKGECPMTRQLVTALIFALATTATSAQAQQPAPQAQRQAGPAVQTMSAIPNNSATVTHWYKQNVYDPGDNKIGEIMDVLIDRDGKATALIIGVGGFLGMGEKDVAVPFNAVQVTTKDNNKWYLVMNATKDSLKSAKGFKYDRNAMTWIPEEASTTGGSPAPGTQPRQSR